MDMLLMDMFVIGLLIVNLLLIASLVYVDKLGFRLIADEFSSLKSYQHNLARDIGNRFDSLDNSLTTVSRSSADAFGLVKDELRQIQASLRGFHVSLDAFRQSQSTALHNVETPLSEVRDIVTAFKNDLTTQVRLSREDYEELMATAESKDAEVLQRLNDLRLVFPSLTALQAQLTEFHTEFQQATGS